MVRNYIRKTTRQTWTIDQLNNAIAAVRSDANFLGRKSLFTKEQEQGLADHVIKLGNLFYGVREVYTLYEFRSFFQQCFYYLLIRYFQALNNMRDIAPPGARFYPTRRDNIAQSSR